MKKRTGKMTELMIRDLIGTAKRAARNAHCPYSGYRVGAALLTADGRTFSGCNVENASYGLTLCAERNAVAQAVGAGARRFKALAVVGGPERNKRATSLPYPCGACRQVLAEFCGPALPVYVAGLRSPGHPKSVRLGDLLPHAFAIRV